MTNRLLVYKLQLSEAHTYEPKYHPKPVFIIVVVQHDTMTRRIYEGCTEVYE